jgi:hypothetical protein
MPDRDIFSEFVQQQPQETRWPEILDAYARASVVREG